VNTRIDPVCGMTVDPAMAAGRFHYEGETYYFCNPNCLRKFSSDPQGYLDRGPHLAAMGRPMVQLGNAATKRDAYRSRKRRIYLPDGP
jgi:YHS domain-containing protein